MNLDIIEPSIFPKDKIKAGVTKKNTDMFPDGGLSFTTENLFLNDKYLNHKHFLAQFLDTEQDNLKFQKQVHEVNIVIVDKNYILETADGMITSERGLYLCVKTADCAAILVYDEEHDVIGAFHSGWRGTQQNIVSVGLKRMSDMYGTKPERVLAYISPCASGEKYEVGCDVARYFPESVVPISNEKYLFDNKKQIVSQLTKHGVRESNIEVSPICTISDEEFHSYRREGKKAGRMAAFISLV